MTRYPIIALNSKCNGVMAVMMFTCAGNTISNTGSVSLVVECSVQTGVFVRVICPLNTIVTGWTGSQVAGSFLAVVTWIKTGKIFYHNTPSRGRCIGEKLLSCCLSEGCYFNNAISVEVFTLYNHLPALHGSQWSMPICVW